MWMDSSRWRGGRSLGLIVLVCLLGAHVMAEEPETDARPNPETILEGLAGLAPHPAWTLEKSDDRSPAPEDKFPAGLPPEHLEAARRPAARETRHVYRVQPKIGSSRMIQLTVFGFDEAEHAVEFVALQRWFWSDDRGNLPAIERRVRPLALVGGSWRGFAAHLVLGPGGQFLLLGNGQLVRRGRTVVGAFLSQCDHIESTTLATFLEYALRRLEDPTAKPPPRPSMEVPSREVRLQIEPSGYGEVGSVDMAWRRAGGTGWTEPRRVAAPFQLALPRSLVQVRIGHAHTPAGTPLAVLGADVIVGARDETTPCRLPRAAKLRVRVVDAAGKPLQGARVRTLSRPTERFTPTIVVMGEAQAPEESIPDELGDGEGRTDPDGWVTMPVPLDKRTLLITRHGTSFMPQQAWIDPGTTERVVRLEKGWVLRIDATDTDGRPLKCFTQVRMEGARQRGMETDDEGHLVLGPIPRRPVHVTLRPDRGTGGMYESASLQIEPTNETQRVTVHCRQIDLEVVDAKGEPVPSCWISYSSPSGHGGGGGFRHEGPARIAVPVVACLLEAHEARDVAGDPLNLRPTHDYVMSKTRKLTLRMKPGRTIHGRVLDPDGLPVGEAEVRAVLESGSSGIVSKATTDAEGRFVLLGLGDERLVLKVDAPAPLAPTRARGVSPTANDEELVLRLPQAVPIRVEDPAGRGVPHVYVAHWAGPELRELYFEVHSDTTGHVYLPDLGTKQQLVFQMQNGEPLADTRRDWDGTPLTVRLARAYAAEVRVTDTGGPVRGAEVEVEDFEDGPGFITGHDGHTKVDGIPLTSRRGRARRSRTQPWSSWVALRARPAVTRIDLPREQKR